MPPITNSSNAVVAGSVDPNLKNPTVHDWSLTIQRDMGHDIVAQVGYVGKRGMRLLRAYDPNQRKLSSEFLASFIRARDNLLVCGDARGTATCGQPVGLLQSILGNSVQTNSTVRTNLQRNAAGSLAAFIDGNSTFFNNMVNVTGQPDFFRTHPQFGDLFYMDNSADSIYHGLQIHVRRQGRNLTFGAAYTFSKSIDNGSVDPVAATSGGAVGNNSRSPTDVFNFAIDRGRSDFDRTHSFIMHAVYDLPFGRTQRWGGSQPMWLQHFIGGWTLTGILTRTTGEPWSVLSGRNTNSNRRFSRANIVGSKPSTGIFDVSGVVGPTVFDANTLAGVPQGNALTGTIFAIPEPGLNGNQGRNIFEGPSYFNLDLGITKGFDITERWKLQFRAEMFNAFNHPNFDNPLNSTDGSTSITSSSFARTCCASVSTPSSTSLVSIGEAARIIQLALRLSF
ncbi:MAG TPA: TonB-dependent receptor, partial [Verrucomicrobiae bacterium]|nr:TonB-dependent receptor [Verrucomicrobiae bacterium]